MKKVLISVVVAFGLFLSAFVTSSAMAGGFTIGIIAGSGTIDTSGSELEGGGDKEQSSTVSVSESLLYGSLFAEYTFGEMYGLTLGASYTPVDSSIGTQSRTDTQTASDSLDTQGGSNDAGTYKAEAEISNHATIYLEPTFMPSDNFGLYLKGGVARVTVRSLASIAFGEDSSAYGDEIVYGGMWGLGTKVVHDSGLLFKLEYINITYNTVKMKSSSGNANFISADPATEAVRLAIGYKF